jgi:hypothetical protein
LKQQSGAAKGMHEGLMYESKRHGDLADQLVDAGGSGVPDAEHIACKPSPQGTEPH